MKRTPASIAIVVCLFVGAPGAPAATYNLNVETFASLDTTRTGYEDDGTLYKIKEQRVTVADGDVAGVAAGTYQSWLYGWNPEDDSSTVKQGSATDTLAGQIAYISGDDQVVEAQQRSQAKGGTKGDPDRHLMRRPFRMQRSDQRLDHT